MDLPSLPYKQLAASLALAATMLLAAHTSSDGLLARGPRIFAATLDLANAQTNHVICPGKPKV
jgi:hypothetical protein